MSVSFGRVEPAIGDGAVDFPLDRLHADLANLGDLPGREPGRHCVEMPLAQRSHLSCTTYNLPVDKFFNAAKRGRKASIVRQIICHRKNGVLTLYMELRIELSLGEKIRADTSHAHARNLGK
jgi:hypothetical protein